MHSIVKIGGFLFLAVLLGGCKKEGFTRLMDVELKYKVVPDAERIRLGDTVKIIAWLPYKQFDRATNSFVDIRDMEVQSWGSVGYLGLDSMQNETIVKKGSPFYETFFTVSQLFGTFKEYPKNHIIGNMHRKDTCFYFQLNLVARKPWVHLIRPRGGRAFMDKGRFRIDITARVVNPNYNHHLSRKQQSIINPYDIDYFFETY